jgi:two-component system response regulator MprA
VLAPRVLVVEDDADLRSLLRRGLTEEGFAVTAAASGAELLERAPAEQPEAVVLDIGLPDADGRDVCQALRPCSSSPRVTRSPTRSAGSRPAGTTT